MEIEAVAVFIVLVFWLVGAGIKALFRLVTGEARREWEEEQRQRQEQRKQDEERERKEAAERQAKSDAKKQFEQAILNGHPPTKFSPSLPIATATGTTSPRTLRKPSRSCFGAPAPCVT